MNIHTSDSLKAMDGDGDNFHYLLDDGEQYQLTASEVEWLRFVRRRYQIADHLIENIEENERGELIYTVDTDGLGDALTQDGTHPKAVMLSDDSALHAIMFYSASDPIPDK